MAARLALRGTTIAQLPHDALAGLGLVARLRAGGLTTEDLHAPHGRLR